MNLVPPGPRRRNQFALGPDYIELDAWQHFDLGQSLRLSTHPDLAVHQASSDSCKLTLLGYALDWSRPDATESDIVKDLASASASFDKCIAATADLGGRWILIFQDSNGSKIFHDAAGLRQICFSTGSDSGSVSCASQPLLLAEVAHLRPDSDALKFIDNMQESDREYWWPGDRQPYCGAQALIPNHYLSLDDKTVARYWPVDKRQSLPYEEVRLRVARKLEGFMLAANRRFDLALGLSAGWDSRVLLAASRKIRDDMAVYTGIAPGVDADHMDVAIPTRLVSRLGMQHDIIRQKTHVDPEFLDYFNSHTWRPHPRFATAMQAEFQQYRHSRLAVVGNVSEIAKLPYRNGHSAAAPVTGRRLAGLVGMADHEFAIQALESWLAGVPRDSGYEVLDIFYLEQRLGRWFAGNCIDFDVGWLDVCAPFNMRSLIMELLACDEKYRGRQHNQLYLDVMQDLWPAVLAEPINPRPPPGIRKRVRRIIRRYLGLNTLAKFGLGSRKGPTQ